MTTIVLSVRSPCVCVQYPFPICLSLHSYLNLLSNTLPASQPLQLCPHHRLPLYTSSRGESCNQVREIFCLSALPELFTVSRLANSLVLLVLLLHHIAMPHDPDHSAAPRVGSKHSVGGLGLTAEKR